MVGHTTKFLRAHTNITAKRTFKPNLQPVRVDGTRVLACVQCRRSLTKAARMTAESGTSLAQPGRAARAAAKA